MTTEAIVNAANEKLLHGGGVAGAISRKGGPAIQRESDAWIREHGSVPTGTAAITGGGNLACKYVIHAVGPMMGSGEEDKKLESAVKSALELAAKHGLKSVAFPAISTGIFGFPADRCAAIMAATSAEFAQRPDCPDEIVFCLWDQETLKLFEKELGKL